MIKPEELRTMLIEALEAGTHVNKSTGSVVLQAEDGDQLHIKFDLIVSVLEVQEVNPGDENYKKDIE